MLDTCLLRVYGGALQPPCYLTHRFLLLLIFGLSIEKNPHLTLFYCFGVSTADTLVKNWTLVGKVVRSIRQPQGASVVQKRPLEGPLISP